MQSKRRQTTAGVEARRTADPRFAAIARLLARAAARRDFDDELKKRKYDASLGDSAEEDQTP